MKNVMCEQCALEKTADCSLSHYSREFRICLNLIGPKPAQPRKISSFISWPELRVAFYGFSITEAKSLLLLAGRVFP